MQPIVGNFWSDGEATIHNGDGLAFMRELPALSVNALVTDPPFFTPATHYQSRVSWGRSWGDMSVLGEFFFQFAQEARRVLTADGHLVCFCHDESYPVFYPVAFGMWEACDCLIWDKTRAGLGRGFRHQYEMILWARDRAAPVVTKGEMHSDVLRHAPTLTRDRTHPVEKPPALIEELLAVIARPGDVVLDPFMGSGTTLEAAKRRGCKAVGVEMESRYCEAAADRLDRTRADERAGQGQLFNIANAALSGGEAVRSKGIVGREGCQ